MLLSLGRSRASPESDLVENILELHRFSAEARTSELHRFYPTPVVGPAELPPGPARVRPLEIGAGDALAHQLAEPLNTSAQRRPRRGRPIAPGSGAAEQRDAGGPDIADAAGVAGARLAQAAEAGLTCVDQTRGGLDESFATSTRGWGAWPRSQMRWAGLDVSGGGSFV